MRSNESGACEVSCVSEFGEDHGEKTPLNENRVEWGTLCFFLARGLLQEAHRVSAGVEQVAVVTGEAQVCDLTVVGEALVQRDHAQLFHAADEVLLHVAEEHRL